LISRAKEISPDELLPMATAQKSQFNKRVQLFIGTHNETLAIVAVRVCKPDCAPSQIDG
jgi:hypothetical protein